MTALIASSKNVSIAQAAVASWAVPEIAQKRAKRFVAFVKVGAKVEEFKSVNKAIQSLGLPVKSRGLRGAALEMGGVTLEVNGQKVQLVAVPKD